MSENSNAVLATPQFAAIFAADLEPEVITCTVGDGLECKFWLRMMDSGDRDRFNSMGVKVSVGADGVQTRQGDLALDERTMFLVSRTLINWEAWQRLRLRDGSLGEWQQCVAPEDPRKRAHYIEQQFKCIPAFWDWLTVECLRVNQMLGDTAGN